MEKESILWSNYYCCCCCCCVEGKRWRCRSRLSALVDRSQQENKLLIIEMYKVTPLTKMPWPEVSRRRVPGYRDLITSILKQSRTYWITYSGHKRWINNIAAMVWLLLILFSLPIPFKHKTPRSIARQPPNKDTRCLYRMPSGVSNPRTSSLYIERKTTRGRNSGH